MGAGCGDPNGAQAAAVEQETARAASVPSSCVAQGQFGGYETWWGGTFDGAYGNFLGDVDGDGKKDLVGLGNGYIGVLRSTGNGFGAYETWWGGSFYGTHGTLLGDVDGDGKADVVGLGDGYIGVMHSTGHGFGNYQQWWNGSFYGSHGTYLADVDGDGKADLVGLGDGYVGVIRSTGHGFGAYETWWGGSFYGSHGTAVTDVDGDGKADLVGIGDGYVGAVRSTGSAFGAYETWSTQTFSGAYGNLFGDVTGDRRADLVGLGNGYIGALRAVTVTPDPITVNIPSIVFDNGVPVGGAASLEVYCDGSYVFSGHFHDSGAVCYDDGLVLALESASHHVFTFSHSGSMGGTFCGGARDDNWNVTGTNPQLAATWTDLKAGLRTRWEAKSSLDLGPIWDDVREALGVVADVIQVVGAF